MLYIYCLATTFPQIEGPTQTNIYGFKTSSIGQSDATRERTEMSIMSLEVFG